MSAKENRGLGKGLSALLGDAPSVDQLRKPVGYLNKEVAGVNPSRPTADIMRVPVEYIQPNPFQPRMSFNQTALEELAASIRTYGLIQPITVRRLGDMSYQIISGERRFKASRMAGMTVIPAYVREADDHGMLEMAIVENVQRENLDPIELALSYQRLIDECDLSQEQMADRVGKKRVTVTNTLRLLKLPTKVQHDLKVGLLSAGHAKALLGIDDPSVQEQLCDLTIKNDLSVRELEALVRKASASGPANRKSPAKTQSLPEDFVRLKEQMGKFFSEEISVKRSASGKGSLTVRFSSDDEVIAFLKAVEGALNQ
ncbi:MAG: ParB/RepB/Spo0J family partition protein [Bacteroidales bacterium]|nr:ParB/RepB/Spo0J family partition protein [Bacteroidales bacterium]